ncbi:MAG TPA: phosphoglycerate kinase [bacterium]|nr:phosphoglycerate kinase [bacterium]
MDLKPLTALKNITGRRILVRCDFDVPLKTGDQKGEKTLKRAKAPIVSDDMRLVSSLPTLKYLIRKKARIILLGHLGRPKGQIVPELSLGPVQKRLAKLLKRKITLVPIERYLGEAPILAVKKIKAGEIIMLENLRFSDREELGCRRFAKALSALGDYYVNEAFAVSHRIASSVSVMRTLLPSFAGLHLDAEIKNLSPALVKPLHPLTLIIGGAKIETKLPVIKQFLGQADQILVGGAVANDFFKALGYEVGQSLIDSEYIKDAEQILLKTQELGSKLILPLDVVVSGRKIKIKEPHNVLSEEMILDIGPKTRHLYQKIISQSKMIIWNGPMGKFEESKFSTGTRIVAKGILETNARCLIGGGETGELFKNKKIPKNIFISVGGGAMLEFLSGKKLPGLE